MRIHPNPSHSDYVSYIKRDVLFPQISPADSITVFVEIDVAVETITTSADDQNYPRQVRGIFYFTRQFRIAIVNAYLATIT